VKIFFFQKKKKILGQALQNAWDRAALVTGPSNFLGQDLKN
jgi:hypothetical protein